MNRIAHVILGSAIAIVFPAFAFYAAVTFIPTTKLTINPPGYPTTVEPNSPASECGYVTPAPTGPLSPQILRCQDEQDTYNQQQTDYDTAQTNYDQAQATYQAASDKVDQANADHTFYRALVAVGIALVGLASLAVAVVPTLVYGLATGAGVTLIAATSAILSSTPDHLQKLAGSILLGLFAISVGLMLWYERYTRRVSPVIEPT